MIPATPTLTGYNAYLTLQDDLASLALSHAPLRQVNVVQERKFLLAADVQMDSLWMNPRNGGAGAGIIIEDIKLMQGGGSDGTLADLVCGFVTLGERNICAGPAGCGLQPEEIDALVAGLFGFKLIEPYGLLRPDGQISGPAHDWIDDKAGIYARRTAFKILNGWRFPANCDTVTISITAGVVQIACTCTAADVQIWFTTDGSAPSNDGAVNPKSVFYTAPFAVNSGTIVRAAAFAPGRNPSALKQKIAP